MEEKKSKDLEIGKKMMAILYEYAGINEKTTAIKKAKITCEVGKSPVVEMTFELL